MLALNVALGLKYDINLFNNLYLKPNYLLYVVSNHCFVDMVSKVLFYLTVIICMHYCYIINPYYRMEDITDPEKVRQNNKVDRNVSLYGYVHGTHMKNNINVHIAGCGDFSIHNMQFLSDPCPTPDREKRRSLNQKERLIYAPMSGVGGIVYDKDAVYIDLGGSHSHHEQKVLICSRLVQ